MPDIDTDPLLSPGQALRENLAGTGLEGVSASTFVAEATQQRNTQTGTTYTPVLADANKLVSLSNAAGITLTVPTNASVPFPVNTRIDLVALGVGQVTVVAAGGVNVRVAEDAAGVELFVRKLSGQYAEAGLLQTAIDDWVLTGTLEAV